jgi:formate-dependent nitrite reductase cytochrome c552 subunit
MRLNLNPIKLKFKNSSKQQIINDFSILLDSWDYYHKFEFNQAEKAKFVDEDMKKVINYYL